MEKEKVDIIKKLQYLFGFDFGLDEFIKSISHLIQIGEIEINKIDIDKYIEEYLNAIGLEDNERDIDRKWIIKSISQSLYSLPHRTQFKYIYGLK